MRIGFIGLGIMGLPMAANLHKAGHTLLVAERASLSAEARGFATVLPDATAVAAAAELTILMLPDTADVENALFGPGGVAAGVARGGMVIDMSSISPTETAKFAARLAGQGVEWLDAPVSGGEVGAKAASLTIMCGGASAAFERALPLLQAMGKSITHVGEAPGSGQVCKVANQIVVGLNIQAVAEALTFARKAGADPAKVREALMGGFAASRILEVHGKRMLDRTFNPGFRIRLHQKDLALALAAGRDLGVALPNTASTAQMMASANAMGGADWDHSGLVRATEAMAGLGEELG